MIAAGIGHGIGQPRRFGVIATHDALQLREFVDHLGTEIRLGNGRGQRRLLCIGPDNGGNLAGETGNAGDAGGLTAELVVEGDIGKGGGHGLHTIACNRAIVVFPEEFRIRQTRGQHLLVPRENGRAIVLGFAVGDGDELLDPARGRVAHGEEFLMLFHRGLKHLWRQTEKILFNITHKHNRPFHQPCHFGQKPLVLDHFKPLRESLIGSVMPDVIGAFLRVEHDKILFELCHIVVKARNRECLGRHKAVPEGSVAGLDAVDLQINHLGPVLFREDTEDGMQRTHPFQAA